MIKKCEYFVRHNDYDFETCDEDAAYIFELNIPNFYGDSRNMCLKYYTCGDYDHSLKIMEDIQKQTVYVDIDKELTITVYAIED